MPKGSSKSGKETAKDYYEKFGENLFSILMKIKINAEFLLKKFMILWGAVSRM